MDESTINAVMGADGWTDGMDGNGDQTDRPRPRTSLALSPRGRSPPGPRPRTPFKLSFVPRTNGWAANSCAHGMTSRSRITNNSDIMNTASVSACKVPCILRDCRSRPKQLREVDTRISETLLGAVQLAEDVRQARTEFIGTDHIFTLLGQTEGSATMNLKTSLGSLAH
jgi:hypothetical protein